MNWIICIQIIELIYCNLSDFLIYQQIGWFAYWFLIYRQCTLVLAIWTHKDSQFYSFYLLICSSKGYPYNRDWYSSPTRFEYYCYLEYSIHGHLWANGTFNRRDGLQTRTVTNESLDLHTAIVDTFLFASGTMRSICIFGFGGACDNHDCIISSRLRENANKQRLQD